MARLGVDWTICCRHGWRRDEAGRREVALKDWLGWVLCQRVAMRGAVCLRFSELAQARGLGWVTSEYHVEVDVGGVQDRNLVRLASRGRARGRPFGALVGERI